MSPKFSSFLIFVVFGLLLFIPPATAHATVQHYLVDGTESHISFSAHSTGHDFQGETSRIDGYFGYDRERITESAYGEIRIPVRGLHTGVTARDRSMYAHFDADHYPEIVFRLKYLSSVQSMSADTFALQLVGELSIKGVTREAPLTLSAVFDENNKIIVSGSAPLQMTDFGIEPPSFLLFHVAEEVQISFRVVGRAG